MAISCVRRQLGRYLFCRADSRIVFKSVGHLAQHGADHSDARQYRCRRRLVLQLLSGLRQCIWRELSDRRNPK